MTTNQKQTVAKVLRSKKTAWKNPTKLYYYTLKEMGHNPNTISANDLLTGMSKGEYPNIWSVIMQANAMIKREEV